MEEQERELARMREHMTKDEATIVENWHKSIILYQRIPPKHSTFTALVLPATSSLIAPSGALL